MTTAATAGTLQSVTPLGASPGVSVKVTGTGLDPVPGNNEVILRLAGGAQSRVEPASVMTIDASRDLRRLTFVVPAGLATGTATLSVLNRTSAIESTPAALEVIAIAVSPATLAPGQAASLRLTGSPNAQFTAGRTLVTLGAGVTVTSTLVESATSVVVGVTVATTAAAGPRTVGVVSSLHQALLPAGLAIASEPLPVNHAPVANAGGPYDAAEAGVPVQFDGRTSSDEDGDLLTYAWDFGDGASAASPTPLHAYASAGTYTVTLTVADPAGASDADTVQLVVVVPADRAPPTLALAAPSTAVPGSAIQLVATATDDVGVVSVGFDVDGEPAALLTVPPYAFMLSVPGVVSTGRRYVVRATARDAGGNSASVEAAITVSTEPDTVGPTVGLAGPPSTAPGAVVALVAQAADEVGVAHVAFMADGVEIARDVAAPFEATYLVPGDRLPGSSIRFGARAIDFSGNTGEAFLDVAVTGVADNDPPSVALTAPAQALPGERIAMAAIASDPSGISGVVLLVGDRPVATLVAPPFEASYLVPGDAVPGTSLTLTARATDFAGNRATATSSIDVIAPVTSTRAVVTGEVYDDTTGLPLPGTRVALTGTDTLGRPYDVEAVSDAEGRYLLRASPGQGALRLARVGWTTVVRPLVLAAGQAVEVFDARLTPLVIPTGDASAGLGGQLVAGGVTLAIPPGFPGDATSLRLTAVSGQGLQGLLPPGWSPVSVVDVAPHDVALGAGATLRAGHGVAASQLGAILVVRWDDAANGWRALGPGRLAGDARQVEADIATAGQYAWLVADAQPAAPPAPVAGDLLTGVALPVVPGQVASELAPHPQVLFYQPGVTSAVRATIVATQGTVSSGARAWARVRESYRFLSGATMTPAPRVHDLLLYQVPGNAAAIAATHVVSPSQRFEALAFERGVITVELFVPPSAPQPAGIAGAEGGTFDGAGGESLVVAPGALSDATPVAIETLDPAELGLILPTGFDVLHGVQVTIGRELTVPGLLSVPLPVGVTDASRLLFARLAEVAGGTRLVLVATARLANGRLVSELTVGGQPTSLEGVRRSGRYLLIGVPAAPAFADGVVRGVGGAPFADALVAVGDYPIVALSEGLGGYTAAGAAGAATVTALDPDTRDTASAQATLVAGSLRRLDLTLVADRPRVVSTQPADGAVSVALSDPIVVTFSEPIDPATIAGAYVARLALVPEGGTRADGTASLAGSNTVLTFRPTEPLVVNTRYTFTLAREIADTSGYQLAADVSFTFDSLDTSPPPVPVAGAITADLPSAAGTTTVTATQGTAGPRDTVWIRNRTTGVRTPALVEANGAFSAIVAAGLTDVLEVVITDVGGNETIVEVPRFRQENPDGSVSVALLAEGGVIEEPGGARVDVPLEALPDGALVTLGAVPISEIPVDVTGDIPVALDTNVPPTPVRYALRSALRLDFGGVTPTRHVNISVPARGDESPGDVWMVARLVEIGGQPTLAVVDTAKLRDGRIVTASPPYPGVTASGTYVVVQTNGPTGTVHGKVVPADAGVDLRFSILTSNATFDLIETLLPFWAQASEPRRMGFPMPAGRVSVTDNSVRLTVEPDVPAPSDRELLVRDLDSGQVQSFPLNPIDYRVQVPWALKDRFDIKVSGPAGEQTVKGARLTAAVPAGVVIRLDPDQVPVPVTRVTVKNLDNGEMLAFGFPLPRYEFGVAGGVATSRRVEIVDVYGTPRVLAADEYIVRPSDYGAGNLLLHVAPGALSSGYPVTKVTLQGPGGFARDVPAEGIVDNGRRFAFDGASEADYLLAVEYAGRPTHYVPIPRFRITVRNGLTGDVVRTISGFVPPPDEPLDLGSISDDVSLPYVVSGPVRTNSFDPAAALVLTFSESMDAQSLKDHIYLVDSQGRRVEGEVRVSDKNRMASFVPTRPLKLGETYALVVEGIDPEEPWSPTEPGELPPAVRDAAGNPLFALRLRVTTFTPRSMGTFAGAAPFKDVAIRRRTRPGSTTLFVTTGGQADNLVALDVTNPRQPLWVSSASAAMSQQRIALLSDVTFTDRLGRVFTGDVAVTAQFNVNFGSMTFFDVTDRAAIGILSSKVLTVNPDLMTGPNPGNTVFATAYAKGIATVPTTTGAAAFAAVEKMGVMAAEVGPNVPQRAVNERLREPVYPGNFADVVTQGGQLFAVSPSQPAEAFVVLSPNLAPLGVARLSYAPRRLRVGAGLQADLDRDGLIAATEVFDLAVVGGDFGVSIVDVRNAASPVEITRIPVPGVVRDVEFDPGTRRVFAGADLAGGGPTLLMIDLSRPTEEPVDADADGFDDRIQFRRNYPNGFNGIRLDRDRGLLYIAHPGGLDVWGVYDSCCDLGVDLTAAHDDTKADGDLKVLLQKEKQALQKGIAAGIREAVARCGVVADDFRMWESGSSACLWADDPVKVCDGNYQPGLSDHDISTWFPDFVWDKLPKVNSEVDEDGKPQAVIVPVCVLNRLSEQFTDADGRPLPITVEGDEPGRTFTFYFRDISFIPDRLRNLAIATYGISRTDPALKGDAVNDMALGRQLLMLKHVTESRWVRAPGYPDVGKPTYPANYEFEVDAADRNIDFEDSLRKMRTRTGIPSLEGYEWTKLMEWMFAKGKGFLRIPGAEDERSAFHDLYVVQMHLAGKAGIRAALARTIADPRGSRRTIDLARRESGLTEPVPDPSKDPFGGRATVIFEKNACLYVDPAVAPEKWLTKPCNSLEEYMASAAAWTLRPWRDEKKLDIFTVDEVLDIYTFYQVKADRISITNPVDAHRFVAKVARYLLEWQNEALPTWLQYTKVKCPDGTTSYAECDPHAPGDGQVNWLRTDNLLTQQRELQKALTAHLGVVPHVYNRSYRDALGVTLSSQFRTPGATNDQTKSAKLDLEGGDHVHPEWETDHTGNVKIEKGKKVPLFMFDIDQGPASRGKTGRGTFTLDVPERTVRESDRQNNWAGFAYYVLDPNNDTPPELPPIDPDLPAGTLLPDAECSLEPTLSISQQLEVKTTTPASPVEPIPVLLESPVVMALRQSATLKLTVTNPTAETIDEVTACTSLTGRCYPVGSLDAGQSVTTDVPFTASAPAVIDAVPTVYSASTSLTTAPPFRIVVGCPRPVIAPFAPDPNPVGAASRIMLDGTSYRHYRVIDRSTGAPLPGVPVTALTTGASLGSYSFTTDVDGVIGKWSTGQTPTFVPGVAIRFVNGMSEGTVNVRLDAGGEERAVCGDADPVIYTVDFVPGEFKEGIRAGSEISAGMSALGGNLQLALGGGLSFTIDSKRHPNAPARERGDLFLARRADFRAKLGYGFKTLSLKLDHLATFEGPKGEAAAGVGLTLGDKLKFPTSGPLAGPDRERLRDALFDPLSTAGFFTQRWWETVRNNWFGWNDDPVVRYRPYKVSDLARISGIAEATGKVFDAKVGFTETDENDETKYDGKTFVKAQATGSAKIGVAYELERQFASGGTSLTAFTPSVTAEGEFEFKGNLQNILNTILDEMKNDTTVRAELEKWAVKKVASKLSTNWNAQDYGGLRLGVVIGQLGEEVNPDNPLRWGVKRVDVSLLSKKPFGFTRDGQAQPHPKGARYTLTYSVSSKDQMRRVLDHLLAFQGILSEQERQRLGLPNNLLTVGASQLLDAFMRFIRLTLENATYTETVDTGIGIANFKLGIEGDLFGNGAKVAVKPLSVDSTATYAREKGVLVGGRPFVLEDYQSLEIAPSEWYTIIVDLAKQELFKSRDLLRATPPTPHPSGTGGEIRSTSGTTLTVAGSDDFANIASLLSTDFQPVVGPTRPAPYRPSDVQAPAGKPHYGIGGFHDFTPSDLALGAAAALALTYADDEVAGIDEQQLRIYRWDDDRRDWDLVGGQVDAAANVVSASVDRLGSFTLAPPMPAGTLTWTTAAITRLGTETGGTTVARLRTDPLRRNDGVPVEPGTIVHVRLYQPDAMQGGGPVPFGRVLTPDAHPDMEGTQVLVGADGRVEIEVELPGWPAGVIVFAFSDVGTAGSDEVVPLEQP